ncbi:glycosyltransferase family 2 protein [Leptobacterium sp. I13]|uniref:glycosyltransferase family 2 protein n=1 Tax=Leptobacterium meishanense TaxID=3128904 RepID=UPI0030EF7D07
MEYYIIMPAHNEEAFLHVSLESVVGQTLLPKKMVIVNDHSSDGTEIIIDDYVSKYPWIQKLNTTSSSDRMPGSKVVTAFNKGYELLDDHFDFIVKLDADTILPPNYFETIAKHFFGDPKIGIAGGFAYEQDETGKWKRNHPMNKDHVRGAFKSYSKACFKKMDGLKNSMGWDTVDELLAKYHGFICHTDESLHVKHLRPVGKAYHKKAKRLQGEAMYKMRYGFLLTFIASAKMASTQKKWRTLLDNMHGFFNAKKAKIPFLVTVEEGVFIRKLRFQSVFKKLRLR